MLTVTPPGEYWESRRICIRPRSRLAPYRSIEFPSTPDRLVTATCTTFTAKAPMLQRARPIIRPERQVHWLISTSNSASNHGDIRDRIEEGPRMALLMSEEKRREDVRMRTPAARLRGTSLESLSPCAETLPFFDATSKIHGLLRRLLDRFNLLVFAFNSCATMPIDPANDP
ncbi:uncharacterized protein CLUP02_06770 [Colletotrichum lupini]|uniref:Uncharacterized protein n=1 Tax=Colletotrichum lupini TaxID=145971 RepID=A0A9Q8SPQ6_9PEZI|nr:uncharacterized protein CLUP02_06770 [Colletotrichum lupini]UQC81284.1 hypothetical protein CLUP02_06770 [Colletotrichum lupini]